MIIGIPKETKCGEKRIALIPDDVEYLARDYDVWVETGAGAASYWTDKEFEEAGAKIVSKADVWFSSDLIVKVKEPQPNEIHILNGRGRPLTIFGYFHIEAATPQLRALVQNPRMTCIAFENVVDPYGSRVLLEPMSKIAGKVAVLEGARYTGFLPENLQVIILGLGNAGYSAYLLASELGADTYTYDIDHLKSPDCLTMEEVREELPFADLVISSVYVPNASAPKILSVKDIKSMQHGSVFVDISIDQGGSSETSRPTSISEPVYQEFGVTHFCVPNMPTFYSRSASIALSLEVTGYVEKLLNADLKAENVIEMSNAIVRI